MVSNFNVTLDPLKPAPVATKLEIAEVRSIRTGREWRSADIIGRILVSFGRVLTARGHKHLLRQQDETGKWERKREMAWRDYKSGHPDYRPDENMVALLSLLSDGRSDG